MIVPVREALQGTPVSQARHPAPSANPLQRRFPDNIRWTGPAGVHSERLAETPAVPVWSFRVGLTEAESFEVAGGAPDSATTFDLIGFGEVARRTFQAVRAAQPEVPVTAQS